MPLYQYESEEMGSEYGLGSESEMEEEGGGEWEGEEEEEEEDVVRNLVFARGKEKDKHSVRKETTILGRRLGYTKVVGTEELERLKTMEQMGHPSESRKKRAKTLYERGYASGVSSTYEDDEDSMVEEFGQEEMKKLHEMKTSEMGWVNGMMETYVDAWEEDAGVDVEESKENQKMFKEFVKSKEFKRVLSSAPTVGGVRKPRRRVGLTTTASSGARKSEEKKLEERVDSMPDPTKALKGRVFLGREAVELALVWKDVEKHVVGPEGPARWLTRVHGSDVATTTLVLEVCSRLEGMRNNARLLATEEGRPHYFSEQELRDTMVQRGVKFLKSYVLTAMDKTARAFESVEKRVVGELNRKKPLPSGDTMVLAFTDVEVQKENYVDRVMYFYVFARIHYETDPKGLREEVKRPPQILEVNSSTQSFPHGIAVILSFENYGFGVLKK